VYRLSPAPTAKAISESVRKYAASFADAFNRRDLVALLAHFSTDAVILPPDRPGVSGTVAIRRYLKAMFEIGMRYEGTEREEFSCLGDVAVETGRYARARPTPDGSTQRDSGRFNATWRVQSDGELRLTSLVMRPERRDTPP
jgi:ketosteroid isomerase-like protein